MAGHFGTKQNRGPVCKVCGEGPKYRSGFCRKDYYAYMRERRKRHWRVICKHCGGQIAHPSPLRKFCSPRCIQAARNLREGKHPRASSATCKECGAVFAPSVPWHKFCGERCSRQDRNRRLRKNRKAAMIEGECLICGAPFTQPRRMYVKRLIQRQPKFCSLQCAYQARRGAESPKFRGGTITYRGAKWLAIAEEIRVRDKHRCGACDAPRNGRKHSVDHVIPFRLMKQWGLYPNDPDNLLTLCGSCHARKSGIEDRLLRGDVVGFLRGLVAMKYPDASIRLAFALAGLSTKVPAR